MEETPENDWSATRSGIKRLLPSRSPLSFGLSQLLVHGVTVVVCRATFTSDTKINEMGKSTELTTNYQPAINRAVVAVTKITALPSSC